MYSNPQTQEALLMKVVKYRIALTVEGDGLGEGLLKAGSADLRSVSQAVLTRTLVRVLVFVLCPSLFWSLVVCCCCVLYCAWPRLLHRWPTLGGGELPSLSDTHTTRCNPTNR